MALFDSSTSTPQTLEDVLTRSANTAMQGVANSSAKSRKRAIGLEGHLGRLSGGVSNYPLTDLDTGEMSNYSDIGSSLGQSLGQIPIEDYYYGKDADRRMALAKLIGKLTKSKNSGIGGMVGGIAGGIGGAFAGGPMGAMAGYQGGSTLGNTIEEVA